MQQNEPNKQRVSLGMFDEKNDLRLISHMFCALRMHSAQGAQGIFSNQNGNPTEMRSNNAILFV